ncbi:MAG: winged helix-turn-helix transcriptional regulator [Candidatus Bathyarchaeota archaeon]|nr:winged helix-turn-helix transcriptional regulator [Candidatus Bathyarchaeota archaeon]
MSYSPQRVKKRKKEIIILKLMQAKDRKLRWSELVEQTGFSKRTLSKRLKDLQREGALKRIVDAETEEYPPPVYYELQKGHILEPVDILFSALSRVVEISDVEVEKGKELFNRRVLSCLVECFSRIFLYGGIFDASVAVNPSNISKGQKTAPEKAAIRAEGPAFSVIEDTQDKMSTETRKLVEKVFSFKLDFKNVSDAVREEYKLPDEAKVEGPALDTVTTLAYFLWTPEMVHVLLEFYRLEKNNLNKFEQNLQSKLLVWPVVKQQNLEKDVDSLLSWWDKIFLSNPSQFFLTLLASKYWVDFTRSLPRPKQ